MKPSHVMLTTALLALPAVGAVSVSNYDDLTEAFYGGTMTYNGVTYSDVNGRAGVFPNGDTFDSSYPGGEIIIENAALFYNDFPGWGSPNNVLTFGSSFIVGDNVSLGGFVHVRMDLAQVADSASMDMAFYENGPWIGIQFHLEAYLGDALVGSDLYTITGEDPDGRDRVALTTMSVGGAEFDSMRLYATYNGEFSAPRLLIDDLTINSVPAPGALAVLGLGGLLARRRR